MNAVRQVSFERLINPPDGWRCSICQEDLDRTNLVTEVGSDHIFHLGCLSNWYRRNPTCPLCRARIVSIPIESYFSFSIFSIAINNLSYYLSNQFPNIDPTIFKKCINLAIRVAFYTVILFNNPLIYDFLSVLLSPFLPVYRIKIISDLFLLALVLLYPNPEPD